MNSVWGDLHVSGKILKCWTLLGGCNVTSSTTSMSIEVTMDIFSSEIFFKWKNQTIFLWRLRNISGQFKWSHPTIIKPLTLKCLTILDDLTSTSSKHKFQTIHPRWPFLLKPFSISIKPLLDHFSQSIHHFFGPTNFIPLFLKPLSFFVWPTPNHFSRSLHPCWSPQIWIVYFEHPNRFQAS